MLTNIFFCEILFHDSIEFHLSRDWFWGSLQHNSFLCPCLPPSALFCCLPANHVFEKWPLSNYWRELCQTAAARPQNGFSDLCRVSVSGLYVAPVGAKHKPDIINAQIRHAILWPSGSIWSPSPHPRPRAAPLRPPPSIFLVHFTVPFRGRFKKPKKGVRIIMRSMGAGLRVKRFPVGAT